MSDVDPTDPLGFRRRTIPRRNLLNRQMDKALSMMRLPPRDDENVCTACGAPDVHCMCDASEVANDDPR